MWMDRRLISVALFDDHEAMRTGLANALAGEGSFSVVAAGGTADEAVACGNAELPDIMMIDLHMPGDGMAAVRRLYRECPYVKSVILTSDDSEHLVSEAFAAGAFGYLTKGLPLGSLIRELKAIAAGRSQFSPGLAASLIAERGIATPWQVSGLRGQFDMVEREEQILIRYAQGLTVQEIADSIGISLRSAGAYLTNILLKLHERSLFETVLRQQAPPV
jgi:DNA-binding NarL/FixJ family response regulator